MLDTGPTLDPARHTAGHLSGGVIDRSLLMTHLMIATTKGTDTGPFPQVPPQGQGEVQGDIPAVCPLCRGGAQEGAIQGVFPLDRGVHGEGALLEVFPLDRGGVHEGGILPASLQDQEAVGEVVLLNVGVHQLVIEATQQVRV